MEPKPDNSLIEIQRGAFSLVFENGYSVTVRNCPGSMSANRNMQTTSVLGGRMVSPDAEVMIFDPEGKKITGEWSETSEEVSGNIEPYWIADAMFWAASQRKP